MGRYMQTQSLPSLSLKESLRKYLEENPDIWSLEKSIKAEREIEKLFRKFGKLKPNERISIEGDLIIKKRLYIMYEDGSRFLLEKRRPFYHREKGFIDCKLEERRVKLGEVLWATERLILNEALLELMKYARVLNELGLIPKEKASKIEEAAVKAFNDKKLIWKLTLLMESYKKRKLYLILGKISVPNTTGYFGLRIYRNTVTIGIFYGKLFRVVFYNNGKIYFSKILSEELSIEKMVREGEELLKRIDSIMEEAQLKARDLGEVELKRSVFLRELKREMRTLMKITLASLKTAGWKRKGRISFAYKNIRAALEDKEFLSKIVDIVEAHRKAGGQSPIYVIFGVSRSSPKKQYFGIAIYPKSLISHPAFPSFPSFPVP